MPVFSPYLNKPIIFNGKYVVGINKKYNYTIDAIKSDIKKKWNVHSCKRIQNCLTNRSNEINDYFNKVSSAIIKSCKRLDIRELIIGYNVNWKTNVNLGRRNNRTFYEIPYIFFPIAPSTH